MTHIYKEGDESVNHASEYAMAVLKKEQWQVADSNEKASDAEQKELTCDEKDSIKSNNNKTTFNQNVKYGPKDSNRLSPTAKSFVSRRSPPLLPPLQTQNIPSTILYQQPKPMGNAEYMRKAFWHPVHPAARIQAHNYLVAQEIARFEAHMKAQRIALHTHYYRSPLQYVRHMPGQYPIAPVKPVNGNSSNNIRVQVVA